MAKTAEENPHREQAGRVSLTVKDDGVDFTRHFNIPTIISWHTYKLNTWTGSFRKAHTENCFKSSYEAQIFDIDENKSTTFDNLSRLFTIDTALSVLVSLAAIGIALIINKSFSTWMLCFVILFLVSILSMILWIVLTNKMKKRISVKYLQNYKSKKAITVESHDKEQSRSATVSMPTGVFVTKTLIWSLFLGMVVCSSVISGYYLNWDLANQDSYLLNHLLTLLYAASLLAPQTSSLHRNLAVVAITVATVVLASVSDYNLNSNQHYSQLVITIICLSVVLFHINRESDTAVRMSFYTRREAILSKYQTTTTSKKTEGLLLNIIPRHVADRLRISGSYSEQHKCVGIIFAEITNFSAFYDESYADGKECLRVLNEIISDIDSLLGLVDKRRNIDFRDIEKIKTIAATYMAASGLNPEVKRDKNNPDHVLQLLRFSKEIQEKLKQFNESMIEFNFLMRIGFNVGEVTSGVVGTKKLLYDIWGDAVNVASRMYSTGQVGYIQFTEEVAAIIENLDAKSGRHEFPTEKVGKVYVKGKGDMSTKRLIQSGVVTEETDRPCEYVPQ